MAKQLVEDECVLTIPESLRSFVEKSSTTTLFVGGKSGPIHKALEPLILDRYFVVDPSEIHEWTCIQEVDLIVIEDAHIFGSSLEPLLKKLSNLADNQLLLFSMPNLSSIESVGTLLSGDLPEILQTPMHSLELRMLARGSAYKLLLDCGWLPSLEDRCNVRSASVEPLIRLVEASSLFGVSKSSSYIALQPQVFFVSARPSPRLPGGPSSAPISVIVPVNNESQFTLNAQLSPGVKEIGAEIIPVRGASSAADAFERGAALASGQWLLFIHQDVYIPRGSGWLLASELDKLTADADSDTPIGFVGVVNCPESQEIKLSTSGTVTDRIVTAREPIASNALALDELGIVIHASSNLKIDPRLGWHCWATDLSLQAETIHGKPCARTLDIPVFHNSINSQLTIDYWQSAEFLLNKYPGRDFIASSCAQLTHDLVLSELRTLRRKRHRKMYLDTIKSGLRRLLRF